MSDDKYGKQQMCNRSIIELQPPDPMPLMFAQRVFNRAPRVIRCLLEVLLSKDKNAKFETVLNCARVAKSIEARYESV